MAQQIVLPIKDSNVLKMVQDTLLDSFRAGRRNYTVFQVGKATLLRVSDVMTLKKSDVYNPDGSVKNTAFIHDKKTGKANTLYLKPVQQDLLQYHDWLVQENINSEWLFPSTAHHDRHITEKQFYKVMTHVGDVLGINLEDKEKKLRVRKPFLDMNSICLHALAILNNSLESDYGKALYTQCKIDVETIFDRLKGSFGM